MELAPPGGPAGVLNVATASLCTNTTEDDVKNAERHMYPEMQIMFPENKFGELNSSAQPEAKITRRILASRSFKRRAV